MAEVEICTWVCRCIMWWVENKLGEENVRQNSRHASMSLGLESIMWSQRRRLMLCIIKALWSRGEQRARGARCLIPLNRFTSSSYRTLRTSAHTQHSQACQWATHSTHFHTPDQRKSCTTSRGGLYAHIHMSGSKWRGECVDKWIIEWIRVCHLVFHDHFLPSLCPLGWLILHTQEQQQPHVVLLCGVFAV